MEPVANDPRPHAVRHESGYWEDQYGALGPARPGLGPRQDPVGDFPTGPDVGSRLPEVIAPDHTGATIDLHADRAGRPAVLVVYRSAVW